MTQDPLLENGVNRVDYSFTKKGVEVLKGSFDATISRGADRFCRTDYIYSGASCQTDFCGQYFAENDYCQ